MLNKCELNYIIRLIEEKKKEIICIEELLDKNLFTEYEILLLNILENKVYTELKSIS